jgi:hypothetical protein
MNSFNSPSLRNVLPNIPSDIVDALETEFGGLESRFARRDWGPAELNGGRFAEAVLRFLEWRESGGHFTPVGTQLNRQQILNRVYNSASLPEGLRFHVAKCSEVLLDIRNKRDVAHLGTTISVDQMDAHLVMRLAAWILAEIIREEGGLSAQAAQDIIDRLSSRRLSLIEEVGGDLVVVATELPARERALVVLYHVYPEFMNIGAVRKAVGYQHTTRFRQIILQHAKAGITYVKGDNAYLTKKGVAWVEENIDMALKF